MNNPKWLCFVGQLALYAVNLALVFWLVEGNFWLKFFLAGVMTACEGKAVEFDLKIKKLEVLFQISDNQVVLVSQQVERFAESERDWERIQELVARVDELETQVYRLTS